MTAEAEACPERLLVIGAGIVLARNVPRKQATQSPLLQQGAPRGHTRAGEGRGISGAHYPQNTGPGFHCAYLIGYLPRLIRMRQAS